jgi:hypothetical protein
VFDRANLLAHHDHLHFAETLTLGLALARDLVEQSSGNPGVTPSPRSARGQHAFEPLVPSEREGGR